MPYTDPTTVRVALTPGGDDTDVGSAASMSDEDLLAAISDATDEVNSKLASRYAVPFTDPAPNLITRITTRIAAYLATLTSRRGDPIVAGEPVQLGYKWAEDLLTQLQNGAAVLAGDAAPDPSPTPVVAVANMLDGDLFTTCDFPTEPVIPWRHRLSVE